MSSVFVPLPRNNHISFKPFFECIYFITYLELVHLKCEQTYCDKAKLMFIILIKKGKEALKQHTTLISII